MKTIWKTSLFLMLGMIALRGTARAEKAPALRLVDMYSKAEGDHFKIHIVASGDISQYKTTRKTNPESYKLIIDVPALPPVNSKYDLDTPFSRRFEVWPMMLGKQVYARISMELNLDASSVVGMDGPTRIWVTVSNKSALAMADAQPAETKPVPMPLPVEDTEPASMTTPGPDSAFEEIPMAFYEQDSDGIMPPAPADPIETPPPIALEQTPPEPADFGQAPIAPVLDSNNEKFFSLFPIPSSGQERSVFYAPVGLGDGSEAIPDGIRLGRFLYRPMVYGSWIRGTNLLLLNDAEFEDSAILVRARNAFDLLYTENVLRLIYELRFKNYRKYQLDDRFSHFFDFQSELNLTPMMIAKIENHFVRGNTESTEYDLGRELAFNTEPFYRNLTRGALQMDFSERLGIEFYGVYNVVEFIDEPIGFYNYTDKIAGIDFLYHLSPLTTVFGEYQRNTRPEPTARPEAALKSDAFLAGIRGEITPMMTGTIRAGYSSQESGISPDVLYFKGLVADVDLVYRLGEQAALSGLVGRANHPSYFESNGYYTSDYVNARFVTPIWRELRLTVRGAFIGNDYPLPAAEIGVPRADSIKNASIGILYNFKGQAFLQADFLHERRDSNLENYTYRNNVLQLIFGWGFVSQ